MTKTKRKQKNQQQKKKSESRASSSFIIPDTKKGTWIAMTIVFIVPVILYLQTVSFGFINFDDNEIITENEAFISDLKNIPEAFKTDAFIDGGSHFYRPMQTLSYMGDLQVSTVENPWMFHLRQVLMLGVIAVLLFFLLLRFGIPKGFAVLGTLIYCLHPLFVSNIAWVPARGDLQLMLFSLLSFVLFIEFLRKKSYALLIFSWIAFTLALFSKETAALLPLVFLLYFFAFVKERKFEIRYAIFIGLFVVSGIVWFWMRSVAIGDFANPDEVIGAFSQNGEVGLVPFLLNIQTIPESLTNFFFPIDIDFLPNFSIIKTMIGIAILLFLAIWLFKNKSRLTSEKLFFIAWFLLLLLPTMLFKPYHIDYLQHRFLLPMVGILLLVLTLLPKDLSSFSNNAVPGVLIVLLFIFAVSTYSRSLAYEDSMTFYNKAIDQNPNSDFAYIHRGYLMQAEGKANNALNDFTKAIEINPEYASAYNNRGVVYAALGQYDKAIADYSKSLKLKPGNVEAYNNRGLAYSYKGLFNKAIEDYNVVIEMDPKLAEGYNNLGMAYGNQGIFDKAIEGFSKAIELKPDYAMAYNNLGLALAAQGKTASACQAFKNAVKYGLNEARENVERYCR